MLSEFALFTVGCVVGGYLVFRRMRAASRKDLKERPWTEEEKENYLAEAKPLMEDITKLLMARGVTGWVAIVALSALLGEAVAYAMANSTMKGYLRVAHRFVNSAFWTAHSLLAQGRSDGP